MLLSINGRVLALFFLLSCFWLPLRASASITSVSLLPSTLPQSGGLLTASAVVTGTPTGVTGELYKNGVDTGTEMTLALASGAYSAQFSIPANSTLSTIAWTVKIKETVSGSSYTATTSADTQYYDNQGPSITAAMLSPTQVLATGGTFNISANVSDMSGNDPGITSVVAEVVLNGVATSETLTPGYGTSYSYTYTVAPNAVQGQAQIYAVTIIATDNLGNVATVSAGTVTQAADTVTIPSVTLNPTMLGPAGGNVLVTATLADTETPGQVTVALEYNGTPNFITQTMNSIGSNQYQTTVAVPANGLVLAVPCTFFVYATYGTATASTSANLTEAAAPTAIPTITGVKLSPSSVMAAGGTYTLSANISSSDALGTIAGDVSINGVANAVTTILSPTTGTGYSGTLDIPANTTDAPIPLMFTVVAPDSANNYVASSSISATQPISGAAVSITASSLSPASITYVGANVKVSATVACTGVVSSVVATLVLNGQVVDTYPMSLSGGSYSATVPIPENTGTGSISYVIDIAASSSGYYASASLPLTQPAGYFQPISIVTSSVSPTAPTYAAGSETVNATISCAGAVSGVTANLLQNGQVVETQTMTLSGGKYTCALPYPENTSITSQLYTVTINAASGGYFATKTLSFTQSAGYYEPISITASSLNPTSETYAGGNVNVSATVACTGTVSGVTAALLLNGQTAGTYPMSLQSGSYTASIPIPENTGEQSLPYSVVITATSGGSLASSTLSLTQATATAPVFGTGSISPNPASAAAGNVTVKTSVTSELQITGLSATLYNLNSGGTVGTYSLTPGTGTAYSGSIPVPANSTNQVVSYSLSLSATTASYSVEQTLTFTQKATGTPPSNPPTLASATVTSNENSTTTFANTGDTANFSVTANSYNGTNYVTVYAYENGVYYRQTSLYNNGEYSPNGTFTGSMAIPVNATGVVQSWTFVFEDQDNSSQGYYSTPITVGPLTQNSFGLPTLASATVTSNENSTTTFANTGDTANFSVTANSYDGTNYVTVYAYENGVYYRQTSLYNNGEYSPNGTFTGSMAIPVNATGVVQSWTFVFEDQDNSSQGYYSTPITVGPLTQNSFGLPTLASATVTSNENSTTTFANTGDTANFSVTANSYNGTNYVTVYAYENGVYYRQTSLYNNGEYSPNGTFTGSMAIPVNATGVVQSWTFVFEDQDNSSQGYYSTPITVGPLTQNSFGLPTLASATVTSNENSTTTFANTGDTANFSVTANSYNGTNYVTVYAYENGVYYRQTSLYNNGEYSPNGTFTGSMAIPVNATGVVQSWTFVFEDQDNSSQEYYSTPITVGPLTQNSFGLPTLASATVTSNENSTTTFANTGDTANFSVTANSYDGTNYVTVYAYENGVYYRQTSLYNNGEYSPNGTFTGSMTIPGNGSGAAQSWTFVFEDQDNSSQGYYSTPITAGPLTQSFAVPMLSSASVESSTSSTTTLSNTGDTASFSVTANSYDGTNYVTVYAYENGVYYRQTSLYNNDEYSPNGTFTGSMTIPGNGSGAAQGWTFVFVDRDDKNNYGAPLTVGPLSQSYAVPTLSSASVTSNENSTTAFANTGDTANFSVTANSYDGTNYVTVYAYDNGVYYQSVNLYNYIVYFNGYYSPNGTFTGSMTIPANTSGLTQNWTFVFSNKDDQQNPSSPITVGPLSQGPTVIGVSPTSVQADTAFTLTVTGSGFATGSVVYWNEQPLVTTVSSSTQLTAAVTTAVNGVLSSYPGTAVINVRNADSTLSPAGDVTITPPNPTVGNISPTSWYVGGSAFTLTVNGSNFVSGSSVLWNGVALTTNFVNSGQLTASVPASDLNVPAETVPITVKLPGGTISTVSALFTISVPPPTISSFSPGSAASGATLTVDGTNFEGPGYSVTAVKIGAGSAMTFSASSATVLTVTVPSTATSGTISVTTPGGTATSTAMLTFISPPAISSFSPTSGPVGTTLTVNGTNLIGATLVTFTGGYTAVPSAVTASSCTVVVPSNAQTGPISVTAPGGSATSAGSFTVIPPPSITSFAPTAGPIGTSVVITGANLSGATLVTFFGGATAVPTNVSSGSATVVVPAMAQTGKFSITTPGGTGTSSSVFTVTSEFTLSASPSALTVNQGAHGISSITLTPMNGFTGSATLTYSALPTGVSATFTPAAVSASTPSTMSFAVQPAATPGTYSITITGTNGTITAPVTITLTIAAHQVLTSIIVSPTTATVLDGATQQFTAEAYDQNSSMLSPQPAFGWTVSGGGTIGSLSGSFTANAIGGPFTVTAASGAVSGTATVTVNGGASITNATIGPSSIAAAGGNATVSATVVDASGTLTAVDAEILLNGDDYKSVALSNSGMGASYIDTFTLPANTGSSAQVYSATVTALDNNGYTNTVNANGQVSVAGQPSTSITGGPANGSTVCTNTVIFTVTGTDAVTATSALLYRYSLDGGAFSAASSTTQITLTGLADGTHVFLVEAVDTAGNIDPVGASVQFTVSTTAPIISAVSASPVDVSATITWTTNKPTTSQVLYGATSAYGSSSLLYPQPVTTHTVTISGLTATTTYHFAVTSTNSCQSSSSADATFTTLATQLPNLETTALSVPNSALEGQTLNVAWTVTNAGLGAATGPWNDDLYLSTSPTLTSGATLLGRYQNPSNLATGQSYAETQQITLPSQVYGSYYLILAANGDNIIPVSNSTDNATAAAVDISKLQQLIVTPATLSTSLVIGAQQTANLSITNESATTLNGISASLSGLPSTIGATVNFPGSLAPGQIAAASIAVTASSAAVASCTPVLHVVDSQGDSVTSNVSLTVLTPNPVLSIQPGTISTGMVEGTQTIYQLTVTNTGGASANRLAVELPSSSQVPWLTLATPSTIGTLAPGASTSIDLILSPSTTLPLGTYTGAIAISGSNAGAQITYSINAVTTATGSIDVTSSDEYTYLADTHPPLTGAEVTITNPQTGAVIATGVTDNTGNYYNASVTAGYYDITVTAADHSNYASSIYIPIGQKTTVSAFLSRQLVTYSWSVIPIPITDTYDVTLTATFQTSVPAPELTVSPSLLNLSTLTFNSNGQAVVDYTLSNHGLIAAQNVSMNFPNQPTYYMAPSTPNLGTIAAESSVTVPVTVYLSNPNPGATGSTCPTGGVVDYSFLCGGIEDEQWTPADVDGGPSCGVVGVGTPPPPYTSVTGSGGGGSGGGSSVYYPYSGGGEEPITIYNSCFPCVGAVLTAVGQCLNGFGTGSQYVAGGSSCASSVSQASSTAQAALSGLQCVAGIGSGIAGSGATALPVYNNITCAGTLAAACPAGTSGNSILSGLLTNVSTESTLAQAEAQPAVDFFGSTKWLSSAVTDTSKEMSLLSTFLSDALPTPTSPEAISSSETTTLEGLTLPAQLASSDVGSLVLRWNNTVADYDAGEFTASQLPNGVSANFVDLTQLATDQAAASAAVQTDAANGYVGLTSGLYGSEQNVQAYLQDPDESPAGVCATVKIQLNQTVELTRTAFQATLDLNDSAQNPPLADINVNLKITDASGHDDTSLFTIGTPDLTVFDGDLGSGASLSSGQTGTAQWTIVPTRQAALTQTTQYYVGGTITYSQNGAQITVPLYPTGITVVPDPYLQFHYFLNQQVYSQNANDLPTIDPEESFYLGLLVQNNGGGAAQNLSITSSQPQVIDNLEGLLINFAIIGTQVNLLPVSPSLTVDLGNVPANGGTAAATFEMTSSLSGQFISFNGTYTDDNPLGNSATTLLDSVDTHFLNHIVQINSTETEPDFLTEELPQDQANDVPETVWQGTTGTTSTVSDILNATVDNQVGNGISTIHLAVPGTPPTGYVFIRIPDPGNGQYALESVMRSDGKVIPIGTDSWLTKRMLHPSGGSATLQTRFYLFDNNTTGAYTLNYYPVAPMLTTIAPATVSAGNGSFTIYASGTGFVNGASILLNGSAISTTFNSSTQLQGTVPASLVATATSINVSVENPMSGSSASGALILTVTPLVSTAVVSITSPVSATTFTAPASITVTATASETGGSIAKVDFYENGTWFGSATSASYTSTFATSSAGSYSLSAVATDGNGVTTTSSSVPVTVTASMSGSAPVPTIAILSPNSCTAGASALTINLTGTGYTSESLVEWNGQPLPTAYVSTTQLSAMVAASFLGQPGSAKVTVVNPSLVSGASSPSLFTISTMNPTITGFNPASGAVGATVTIDGSNFVGADLVTFSGGATAVPSSVTASTAAVTVPNGAKTGVVSIATSTGTGTSTTVFKVLPTLTSFAPLSGPAGSTVVLSGSGFTGITGVTIGGTAASYSFVSDSTIDVTVPAAASTGIIIVTTATGSSSSATSFVVTAATTMTVTALTGAVGQSVNLAATLMTTTGGSPVSGQTITFVVAAKTAGTAITTAAGVATLPYTVTAGTGNWAQYCTATFAGNSVYATSTGSGALTVTSIPTTCGLILSPTSGMAGQVVTIEATLSSTTGSVLLTNRGLNFYVDGVRIAVVNTNSSGAASTTYTIPAGDAGGAHTVKVYFSGDSHYATSSNTTSLTVITQMATSMTTAALTGAVGQTVTLTGTLVASTMPLSGATVSFSVNGAAVGTATTNSSGVATLAYVVTPGTGSWSQYYTATYAANTTYLGCTSSATIAASNIPTALAVTTAPSVTTPGQSITITAALTSAGGGFDLANRGLNVYLDGTRLGGVTTNSSGMASTSYYVPTSEALGAHTFSITYAGDTHYLAASGSAPLTVVLTGSTAISVNPVTAAQGQTENLSGTLVAQLTSTPVSGRTLTFSADGTVVGTAVTNSSGVGSLPYSSAVTGSHTITVAFAGDSTYLTSTGTGSFTVVAAGATTMTVVPATGAVGQTVTLSATVVTTAAGTPLANRSLSFAVNGATVGTAVTNASGTATLQYVVTSGTGSWSQYYSATFAADGYFTKSTATAALTATTVPTSIAVSVTPSASVSPGATITIAGTLTTATGDLALSGRGLNFYVDGVRIAVVNTVSTGVATTTFVLPTTESAGSHTVQVTFTGDSHYAASMASTTISVT